MPDPTISNIFGDSCVVIIFSPLRASDGTKQGNGLGSWFVGLKLVMQ